MRHRRADLLGETSDLALVHMELQSTNHPKMAVRMLEYGLAIHRKFHRFPEQIVLYVGGAPMQMRNELITRHLSFRDGLVDIRELDGEPLLASSSLEDNVLAILTRLRNELEAVRRILARIAASQSDRRGTALAELMVLAGLRRLGKVIEREIENMPILDDIMEHEVLGRERRRGIAIGREEGERLVVQRQISKRFGTVPDWAKQRLDALSGSELEQVELRLLDAATLEELLA